tara:strand:+ start:18802 stop:19797 length:996 start_codon:yes stop_codon:yes gene_type:complete
MPPKFNIGISTGDLNGIGLEIIIKSLKDPNISKFCTLILFGSKELCKSYLKKINSNTTINIIKQISDSKNNILNLIDTEANNNSINLGVKSITSGLNSYISLNTACNYLKENKIDAIVTAPIDKASIRKSIDKFIGHTEFLEQKFGGNSLMLMVSSKMKIAFVTGHIPLSNVSNSVSLKKIIEASEKLNNSLKQDFNISHPKIAVLGLNPHAGEDGMLGLEEKTIITPAIAELNKKDMIVKGPFPADSFFVEENLNMFDGIIAMYHDQGLIPFKSMSFSKGVNFTAGLSIIRTSPVHGTAYDIAGMGKADASSFIQAILVACDIIKNRRKE